MIQLTEKQQDLIWRFYLAESLDWNKKHLLQLRITHNPFMEYFKNLSIQEIYNAGLEWRLEMNKKSLEDLGVEIF